MQKQLKFEDFAIGLAGVPNARELGGYRIGNKHVKRGKLLRSGNLSRPSADDVHHLANDLNLRLIVDLRSEYEMQIQPDAAVGSAEHLPLPAIDEGTNERNGFTIPKEAYQNWTKFLIEFVQTDIAEKLAREMYPTFIRSEYTQRQLGIFMRRVTDNADGAVLWHCAQGKDRTGICSAIVLGALGAEKDLILSDFALSNDFYANEIDSFCQLIKTQLNDDSKCLIMKSFVGVNVDFFEEMLNIIDKEYGSMNDYLIKRLNLTDKDLDTLKIKYLE